MAKNKLGNRDQKCIRSAHVRKERPSDLMAGLSTYSDDDEQLQLTVVSSTDGSGVEVVVVVFVQLLQLWKWKRCKSRRRPDTQEPKEQVPS